MRTCTKEQLQRVRPPCLQHWRRGKQAKLQTDTLKLSSTAGSAIPTEQQVLVAYRVRPSLAKLVGIITIIIIKTGAEGRGTGRAGGVHEAAQRFNGASSAVISLDESGPGVPRVRRSVLIDLYIHTYLLVLSFLFSKELFIVCARYRAMDLIWVRVML